jgi:hypothetical protein
MECYSAIKKNEIMLFAGKCMELEITMLSEMSQAQKDKYHIFVHMQNMIKVYYIYTCVYMYINIYIYIYIYI